MLQTSAARLVAFFALMFVAALPRSSFSANTPSQPPSSTEISEWIQMLSDDTFSVRETAMRNLQRSGRAAVKPIALAVLSDDLETSWRAAAVLEQIGVSGDQRTMAEVIVAIDQLSDEGRKRLARSRTELAVRWRKFRHQQAVVAIRNLGGEVIDAPPQLGWGAPQNIMLQPLPQMRIDLVPIEVEAEDVELDEFNLEIPEIPDQPELDQPAPVPNVERVEAAPKDDAPAPQPAQQQLPEIEDDAIKMAIEALKKVEVQQAEVEVMPDFGGPIMVGGGGIAMWAPNHSVQNVTLVRLGSTWKGTDDDLRRLSEIDGLNSIELTDFDLTEDALQQLTQLSALRRLTVQGSNFEPKSLLQFKQARPEVTVYAIGTALLGISGQFNGGSLVVQQVVAGSGAANAGMLAGDVVVSADGIPVSTIDELTVIVAQKKVGDILNITLRRDGEVVQVKATLGDRGDVR